MEKPKILLITGIHGNEVRSKQILNWFLSYSQVSLSSQMELIGFDIFVEKLNLCIEFDGPQHFKSTPLYGGKSELEKTIFRDNIKNEYCKQNNIPLIRIKYNEDIENILNERLKNL